MSRYAWSILSVLLAAATSVSPQQEWKDPSPHATTFVTVEEGVQLEVLDWGGSPRQDSGQAPRQGSGQTRGTIVLLAGGGASAHHYDDFAPALVARGYRVVGLTRRSHRGSSAAPGGYGFVRLAEDVMRVIDAVGVNNPIVIGESFAGEEMHVLGARHSTKIKGLVYVDAAFDRGDNTDNEAYSAASRPVPAAPSPQEADLASFTTLRAYLEKYGGAGPDATCGPGTALILTEALVASWLVSTHVQMATTGTPVPIPTTCILPLMTSKRR
jgi:pimeloyl-ACP methyl ester carboxylesterase